MSTAAIAGTVSALVTVLATTVSGTSLEDFQSETLWLLVVGFIIAFILAFAVGANDVANSFGTTVGAKTLTLRQACILASVFETLGAILLGAKVGETIRKGIIDADIYQGEEDLLMLGEVSAMIGSGLWQLVATFLKLPVSGTHSIVGATVGFSLVAMGFQGVNWVKMGLIVASWFVSPVMAGAMAALFYIMLRKLIFLKENPVVPGLIAMPILYGGTVAINCFSVFYSGAPLLGFNMIPVWGDFVIAAFLGLVVYIIVRLVVVERMKRSIQKDEERQLEKALLPAAPNNPIKKTILPPVLETISEKEPLMVDSVTQPEKTNGRLPSSGNMGAGDAAIISKEAIFEKLKHSPRKSSRRYCSASGQILPPYCAESNGKANRRLYRQQSVEDEKQSCEQNKTRTHSAGEQRSVRIPPVLQLEKNVLKTRAHEPSIQEIKEGIKKNFSEPSMISLAENMDGDFFEVHINRQKRAVTIQRKRRFCSGGSVPDSSTPTLANGQVQSNDGLHVVGDMDGSLEGIPPGHQVQLEEPFDDSEDEGMGLMMKTCDQDVMVLASDQKSYTGAIEEGFRTLTTVQGQNRIEIKVAEGQDEDSETGELKTGNEEEDKEDRAEVRKIFSFLQILTACFGAFAHGGNDVSNAIGPLIALYIIYSEGSVEQKSYTPLWLLLYGGLGICFGLWVWGRRVIKTMGEDLTNLTPSRGFTIELMSGATVLAASNVGIPVSTTHCKVGAVVSVGWVRSREAVDWKIFRNIVLAWFVTVPVSGGLSAVVFLILRQAAGI